MLRNKFLAAALASLPMLSGFNAVAQTGADNFPSKPVTIILNISPGSATEPEVRIYAQKMTEYLSSPFLLDFKAGGGGMVGAAYVARATPDGHTLLSSGSSFMIAPLLSQNAPYDPLRDLAPVSHMSKKPNIMVVNSAFPAKNLAEYIAYSRANPEKVNFGTSGQGGPLHLVGAWIHNLTNTKITFIHYKGGAPIVPDLLAGRLDVALNPLAQMQPIVQTGKIRALAILASERVASAPDLPTAAEQVPALKDIDYWADIGILAPRNTPAAVVNKLSLNLARAAKSPDVAKTLAPGGSIMVGSTPEQYRQKLTTETQIYRKLIKDNNIVSEE